MRQHTRYFFCYAHLSAFWKVENLRASLFAIFKEWETKTKIKKIFCEKRRKCFENHSFIAMRKRMCMWMETVSIWCCCLFYHDARFSIFLFIFVYSLLARLCVCVSRISSRFSRWMKCSRWHKHTHNNSSKNTAFVARVNKISTWCFRFSGMFREASAL